MSSTDGEKDQKRTDTVNKAIHEIKEPTSQRRFLGMTKYSFPPGAPHEQQQRSDESPDGEKHIPSHEVRFIEGHLLHYVCESERDGRKHGKCQNSFYIDGLGKKH